jgi:hypothetical protein
MNKYMRSYDAFLGGLLWMVRGVSAFDQKSNFLRKADKKVFNRKACMFYKTIVLRNIYAVLSVQKARYIYRTKKLSPGCRCRWQC